MMGWVDVLDSAVLLEWKGGDGQCLGVLLGCGLVDSHQHQAISINKREERRDSLEYQLVPWVGYLLAISIIFACLEFRVSKVRCIGKTIDFDQVVLYVVRPWPYTLTIAKCINDEIYPSSNRSSTEL
jgi:hypothetical protein